MSIDISNLGNCVKDCSATIRATEDHSPDVPEYRTLRTLVEKYCEEFPPLYRDAVVDPYLEFLDGVGEQGFGWLIKRRDRTGFSLVEHVAQAILQHGGGYLREATNAFQEVISDVYDGFLSSEDRRGTKLPEVGAIAPLAKWKPSREGPYSHAPEATRSLGLKCGIVNLNPAYAQSGLLAWATLPHETAGHEVLGAESGMKTEICTLVVEALTRAGFPDAVVNYWRSRVAEAASDVMAVLNMGPAFAVGLIGFLRGTWEGPATLRTQCEGDPEHPLDVLRGYLCAGALRLLSFSGKDEWADIIDKETTNDVSQGPAPIRHGSLVMDPYEARYSAKIVAQAIAASRLKSLDCGALLDVQDWTDGDEEIVRELRRVLATGDPIPRNLGAGEGYYAAHTVAAATMEGVSKDCSLPDLLGRMVAVLNSMHENNPSWGPLNVQHPGDLAPRMFSGGWSGPEGAPPQPTPVAKKTTAKSRKSKKTA